MSLLHVQSEVCMSLFHVRSKVCIAPIHVQSKFADFAPHMDGSNADFAPHIEKSHADFAPHIEEQRQSFRDQKIAQITKSAILKKNILLKPPIFKEFIYITYVTSFYSKIIWRESTFTTTAFRRLGLNYPLTLPHLESYA